MLLNLLRNALRSHSQKEKDGEQGRKGWAWREHLVSTNSSKEPGFAVFLISYSKGDLVERVDLNGP